MLSFRKSPRLLQEKRGKKDNNLSNIKQETIANSNTSGKRGDIRFDNQFVYICVADNSWKRAQLLAF